MKISLAARECVTVNSALKASVGVLKLLKAGSHGEICSTQPLFEFNSS